MLGLACSVAASTVVPMSGASLLCSMTEKFLLLGSVRTGECRGFAFVRYKYADEAQKAVDKVDGLVSSPFFG